MSNSFCESSMDFYDMDRGYDDKMDDIHAKALVYDYIRDNPKPVEGGGAVLMGLMRDAGATVVGPDLTATEKDDLFSTMAGGDPTDLLGEECEVRIRKVSWAAGGDEPTVHQNSFVLIPVPGEEYRPVPAEDLNALHAEALRMDYKFDLACGLIPEAGGYMATDNGVLGMLNAGAREMRDRLEYELGVPLRTVVSEDVADSRLKELLGVVGSDTEKESLIDQPSPELVIPGIVQNLLDVGRIDRMLLLENVVKLYRVELEELLAESAPVPKPDLRLTREDEVDLLPVRIHARRGAVHLTDRSKIVKKTLCGLPVWAMAETTDDAPTCQRCLHSGELRGWKPYKTWHKRMSGFLRRFR